MTEISHDIILESGKYKNLSITNTDPEVVLNLYRFMLRLRRLQEQIINQYHPADQIRCPVHFCIGQEAVPAAISQLIGTDDFLFGPHRSHGYYLAKGGSMKALLAELYGRQTGANGGKTGSQEISVPAIKFYSGAILSGLLAIAVGVGLGFKLKNQNNVAVVGFGDGAIDEGIFWEAITYAQLAKLPVVFVCENNRYSTYSPQLKRQPKDDIHTRVEAFGLMTQSLFGNDVIAVMSAMSRALEYARSEKGPAFIETYTYRWKGHVGPEDDDYIGYRPQSELDFWKDNCPIALLEEQMTARNLIKPALKQKLLADIDKEIAEAFEFAKNSPFPTDQDWENLNYNNSSSLADKLLQDTINSEQFNQNQLETVPAPY